MKGEHKYGIEVGYYMSNIFLGVLVLLLVLVGVFKGVSSVSFLFLFKGVFLAGLRSGGLLATVGIGTGSILMRGCVDANGGSPDGIGWGSLWLPGNGP